MEKDTNNLCIVVEHATRCVAAYVDAARAAEKAVALVFETVPKDTVLDSEVNQSLHMLSARCVEADEVQLAWVFLPARIIAAQDRARAKELEASRQNGSHLSRCERRTLNRYIRRAACTKFS